MTCVRSEILTIRNTKEAEILFGTESDTMGNKTNIHNHYGIKYQTYRR